MNINDRDHHHVAIFWDYENCAPPCSMPGYDIVNKIRQIAHEYGSVKLFKAYLELSEQSSSKSIGLRSELQSCGVSLTDCPHNGRKDVADKMMIVDMLTYAIDTPAPATIILISGDRDFVYAVSVLRLRRYHVVLVAPHAAHYSLRSQSSVVVDWDSDVLGKTARSGPDTNASCISDTAHSPRPTHLSLGPISSPTTHRTARRSSFRDIRPLTPHTPLIAGNGHRAAASLDNPNRGTSLQEDSSAHESAGQGYPPTPTSRPVSTIEGEAEYNDPIPDMDVLLKDMKDRALATPSHNHTTAIPTAISQPLESTSGGPSGVLASPVKIDPPRVKIKPVRNAAVPDIAAAQTPKNDNIDAPVPVRAQPSSPSLGGVSVLNDIRYPVIRPATVEPWSREYIDSHSVFDLSHERTVAELLVGRDNSLLDSATASSVSTLSKSSSSISLSSTKTPSPMSPRISLADASRSTPPPVIRPPIAPKPIHPTSSISPKIEYTPAERQVPTAVEPAQPIPLPRSSKSDDSSADRQQPNIGIPTTPLLPKLSATAAEYKPVKPAPLPELKPSASPAAQQQTGADAPKPASQPAPPKSNKSSASQQKPVAETPKPAQQTLPLNPSKSSNSPASHEQPTTSTEPQFLPIPPHFVPLLQMLESYRLNNVHRPLRGTVALRLAQQAKDLYKLAGVTSFKAYTSMALQAGMVELGGMEGQAWISLSPEWHGKVVVTR
ncbi:hypothetical protein A0H81_04559 [Grifola frondosa]|uniref:NYN domain-containing protein n=1 Tax=Grifola frondosa TaxID=5627 RepID=A0A1C7MGA5_GRIFR|nr:hypothetical protein A0H81_04559 [Grifola frondosa]